MSDIFRIGVVGAGQMGRGIAQVAAQAGYAVRVVDASEEALAAGVARTQKELSKLVDKGKLSEAEQAAVLDRLDTTTEIGTLADCDYVIEAATEALDIKLRIFEELDRTCPPHATIASNTSSISLTKLAAATQRPSQVIGMHFMNPAPVMKLVEVVRALQTSDATYQATCAIAEKMGKTVVTTKDMPGFIVNRMLVPFINEACFALQDSLGTAEDIDQAARLGLNHPMGPLELADLIGLDTVLSIAEVLHREFGEDKYRAPTLLRKYVAAGWLGRKTNHGFYVYSEGRREKPSGKPPAA